MKQVSHLQLFLQYICAMNKKHFTPDEAWVDFLKNIAPHVAPEYRNQITVARRTWEGKVWRDGKRIFLGVARIRRLLETHAPDRYTFHYGEPWFEIKKPPTLFSMDG